MENDIYFCPLCKSTNSLLYVKGNEFDIVKCNECNNARTFPSPKAIDYEVLDFHLLEISKEDKSPKNIEGLPKSWQNNIKAQIELIKKYIPIGGSILEIGCGEGIFLNELRKIGYETFGVEPSFTAVERARKNGLNVVQGYYPHDKLYKRKFDLIFMSHVLEHIEQPSKIFASLQENLIDSGKVLLIQTNYLGLIPKFKGKKWYAWVPDQHFWHFTAFGIKYIAQKYGFKEVKTEYSSLVHVSESKSLKDLLMFLFDNFTWPKGKDQFHILLSYDIKS